MLGATTGPQMFLRVTTARIERYPLAAVVRFSLVVQRVSRLVQYTIACTTTMSAARKTMPPTRNWPLSFFMASGARPPPLPHLVPHDQLAFAGQAREAVAELAGLDPL